ncbi:hypothetical protein [Lelliottia wanjuensis]|uniref:hypothetical protein n=1 Tax=Lelliottia wanjuensis TaxID=3050585 RepID=UPI00254D46D0|nr:hypothetical protein [Lelliottia sp. V86_10]MDK9585873.1 hypothetical protein [Lelliottia sp. V86_10]
MFAILDSEDSEVLKQLSDLTPTEKLIQIEREAIPGLLDYQFKIKQLCDEIEGLKDSRGKFITDYVNDRINRGSHPKVLRVTHNKTTHPVSVRENTEQLMKLASEGYTLLKQVPEVHQTRYYFIEPGFSIEQLADEVKPDAERECDKQLAYVEQKLSKVRSELTSFKKTVLQAKAQIMSLEELMKAVK